VARYLLPIREIIDIAIGVLGAEFIGEL